MAKLKLVQAACAVALLASAPAFAQSNTEVGATGQGGGAVNPTAHETMPSNTGGTSMSGDKGNMMPAHGMNASGSQAAMDSHSTHRAAMGHMHGMMHGRNDRSQDAAVDQLNEQSYQAAQNGQAFNGSTMSGSTAPAGSGGMKGMSGDMKGMNGMSGDMSKMNK